MYILKPFTSRPANSEKYILCKNYNDDESLSKFLVRNGYAFAFVKYSKKYVEDEKYAKKNNLGLWAMEFEFPWDFRKTK